MSVTIFYGDNEPELDQASLLLKKKYTQVIETDELLEVGSVREQFVTVELFEEPKLFIFKNILANQTGRGGLSKKASAVFEFLSSYEGVYDMLFIEKEGTKAKYYKEFFKKATYKEFKLSPYLFYFLDQLKPKSGPKAFEYFEKTIKTTAVEMILFMMKRRTRELLLLQTDALKGNYQPWQLGKLKSQLSAWQPGRLERFYQALFNVEEGVKTGASPLPLETSIGFVLGLYL